MGDSRAHVALEAASSDRQTRSVWSTPWPAAVARSDHTIMHNAVRGVF
jgi:hypothetical protein